jgi:hypothetical protein
MWFSAAITASQHSLEKEGDGLYRDRMAAA